MNEPVRLLHDPKSAADGVIARAASVAPHSLRADGWDDVMVRASGSRFAPSRMTTAPLTGPEVAASRTVPPMTCPRRALALTLDIRSAVTTIRSIPRCTMGDSG